MGKQATFGDWHYISNKTKSRAYIMCEIRCTFVNLSLWCRHYKSLWWLKMETHSIWPLGLGANINKNNTKLQISNFDMEDHEKTILRNGLATEYDILYNMSELYVLFVNWNSSDLCIFPFHSQNLYPAVVVKYVFHILPLELPELWSKPIAK